jgi:transcriptional regulator with XRE-family HTH domain
MVAIARVLEHQRIMNKPTLAAWLRGRLELSNMTQTAFAESIGLNKKTLNYLLRHPDHIPTVELLGQLAEGTGTPIDELIGMLGFPTGRRSTATTREAQIARLLEQMPALRQWIDVLSQMDARQLEALAAYRDGLLDRSS